MSFLHYSTDYHRVVDIFMHTPDRYLPFARFLADIMSGDAELSRPQLELIALYVSQLNDCQYCVDSHKAVLAGLGVDEATISAAQTGSSSEAQTAEMLSFTAKLTRSPGTISQENIDSLRRAGWSDEAIEEMINVVGLFSFINRLVDGIGIKGTAQGMAQAGSMVAKHGYGPVVQMLQKSAEA